MPKMVKILSLVLQGMTLFGVVVAMTPFFLVQGKIALLLVQVMILFWETMGMILSGAMIWALLLSQQRIMLRRLSLNS